MGLNCPHPGGRCPFHERHDPLVLNSKNFFRYQPPETKVRSKILPESCFSKNNGYVLNVRRGFSILAPEKNGVQTTHGEENYHHEPG